MNDQARRSSATIAVNGNTLQLAESIASRYGVSINDLIDMLLLELVHRVDDVSVPPASRQTAAPVIDLASRRRQQA